MGSRTSFDLHMCVCVCVRLGMRLMETGNETNAVGNQKQDRGSGLGTRLAS